MRSCDWMAQCFLLSVIHEVTENDGKIWTPCYYRFDGRTVVSHDTFYHRPIWFLHPKASLLSPDPSPKSHHPVLLLLITRSCTTPSDFPERRQMNIVMSVPSHQDPNNQATASHMFETGPIYAGCCSAPPAFQRFHCFQNAAFWPSAQHWLGG